MALAFEVGQTEGNLPGSLRAADSWEALPIIQLAWEALGREDHRKGHHHDFDIGDGHASRFCLFLRILHHDNELGDAIRLHIILCHILAEGDHVNSMQPPTVSVEEGHDVEGCDLCVERLGVLEIVVPDLGNDIAKECGNASFGHLITGLVIEAGFMGGLCSNADDCRGVAGDAFIVEGETGGPDELGVAVFASYLTASARMAVRE